jgi:hypothetical protein
MNLDASRQLSAKPPSTAGSFTITITAIPSPSASFRLDPKAHITRRWYYFIPAPRATRASSCTASSRAASTRCPAPRAQYSSWQELHAGLENLLQNQKKIAMQYSPNNDIMYVSMVDAGTVEFLRSLGKEIVTSADLVSQFEAVLSKEQIASHKAAQRAIDAIVAEAGTRLPPPASLQRRRPQRRFPSSIMSWLQRSHAPRRPGLGKRSRRQRQRQHLRLALRAHRRALRAHPRGRLPPHRYLGPSR